MSDMNNDIPDEVKYPNRYSMADGGKRYSSLGPQTAADYLQEWHTKGYTGNYIPASFVEEEQPELWEDDDEWLEEWHNNPLKWKLDKAVEKLERRDPVLTIEQSTSVDLDSAGSIVPGRPVDENRITDPESGGQKGEKAEEYAYIPSHPLAEVARVYGTGAKKYEPWNWSKGYAWRLSYSALYRHIEAHRRGESVDPDSGHSHLAHAAFHLFTLMEFERLGLGTDDRWKQ